MDILASFKGPVSCGGGSYLCDNRVPTGEADTKILRIYSVVLL